MVNLVENLPYFRSSLGEQGLIFISKYLTLRAKGRDQMVRVQIEGNELAKDKIETGYILDLATPGQFLERENVLFVWVAPNEWIVRSTTKSDEIIAAEVEKALNDVPHLVTIISDSRFTFHVAGECAEDYLSVCCSLNFLHGNFAVGASTITRFLGQSALLLRLNTNEFEVIVDSAFTQFVLEKLVDVAQEFLNTSKITIDYPVSGLK